MIVETVRPLNGTEPVQAQAAVPAAEKPFTGNLDAILAGEEQVVETTSGPSVTSEIVTINGKHYIALPEVVDSVMLRKPKKASGRSSTLVVKCAGTYEVAIKGMHNGQPYQVKRTVRPPNFNLFVGLHD